jgi:hypothetical protein
MWTGSSPPCRRQTRSNIASMLKTPRASSKNRVLSLVECWGDDVPKGEVTDFYRAVQAKRQLPRQSADIPPYQCASVAVLGGCSGRVSAVNFPDLQPADAYGERDSAWGYLPKPYWSRKARDANPSLPAFPQIAGRSRKIAAKVPPYPCRRPRNLIRLASCLPNSGSRETATRSTEGVAAIRSQVRNVRSMLAPVD